MPHQVVVGRKQRVETLGSLTNNLKAARIKARSVSAQRLALDTHTYTHTFEGVCVRVCAGGEVVMTLKQTCSWEYPRAQVAFKDSMIH